MQSNANANLWKRGYFGSQQHFIFMFMLVMHKSYVEEKEGVLIAAA